MPFGNNGHGQIERRKSPICKHGVDRVKMQSVGTVNPRYNDRICSQRCCHYNEFVAVKNP